MRIVSLLPSATEIICSLGLRDQLVGITHECDYPNDVRSLPTVTRTLIPHDATSSEIDALVRERLKKESALYSLDREMLQRLQPDVLVTQALCDVCAVAEHEIHEAARALRNSPQVINLEPTCLQDVFDCIAMVGSTVGIPERADAVIAGLKARVDAVTERAAQSSHRPRVLLLEWIDPPFSAGHWSPELVDLAGGCEVMGVAGARSTTIAWDKVVEADPELMVIACCGLTPERARQDLPILESYPGWSALSCVRSNQVHIVDGSAYFSRPGPRLVDSLEILAELVADCESRLVQP